MGKIVISIEVSNNIDVGVASRNYIPESEIRKLTIENVLVDTGATTLILPKKYIEELGLTLDR